ncbi:hypothetical protein ACUNV4_16790 [Granulosicoccus sp. 3-233]|uniref:hypothetical protein n=1 Tax=Granulosicoccus sp. 3-233 TaxID=3417969 RepID=UPI003D33FFB8
MRKPGNKQDADQSFWKAMQKDLPPDEQESNSPLIDLTADLSEHSPEELEKRRRSLLAMLANNEARKQQVQRHRLPALTPGLAIAIKAGPYQNRKATVKDADYIHSRALLHIDGEPDAQWVDFSSLAPVIDTP